MINGKRTVYIKYGNYTVYFQMAHITYKLDLQGVSVIVPSFSAVLMNSIERVTFFWWFVKVLNWPGVLIIVVLLRPRHVSFNSIHNKAHYDRQRTSIVLCGRYHAFTRLKTFILPIKNDFSIVNLCIFDVKHSNHLLVGSETRSKLWKQYQEWGVLRK